MTFDKKPKVSLVGAGPGSEDLITVRGLTVLKAADVILYDALVNEEILSQVNADILKIYVGKRCSQHSFTQDDINILIVD